MDGVCSCVFRVTRSIDDGAECEVRCAVDPIAREGGQYFELTRDGEFIAHRSSEVSYDVAKQQRLLNPLSQFVSIIVILFCVR